MILNNNNNMNQDHYLTCRPTAAGKIRRLREGKKTLKALIFCVLLLPATTVQIKNAAKLAQDPGYSFKTSPEQNIEWAKNSSQIYCFYCTRSGHSEICPNCATWENRNVSPRRRRWLQIEAERRLFHRGNLDSLRVLGYGHGWHDHFVQ